MNLGFNREQIKDLSNFSTDVAKGLMLAGVLGQGFDFLDTFKTRIIVSIYFIILSLIFLWFGIELKKTKLKRKRK